VLETLQAAQEPLQPDELAIAVDFVNEGGLVDIGSQASWSALETLVAPAS